MTKMNLLPAFNMEYSSDEEDIYQQKSDEIYRIDKNHMESDKKNGKYYIGIYSIISVHDNLLLSTSVSPQTFFQYPFNDILTYLHLYSISLLDEPNIEIMKLCIKPDETNSLFQYYTVIVKTFWIKLIQRHWKKIYASRQSVIQKRATMFIYYQTNGKYPDGYNQLPSIRGLMSSYTH